jgi:hypothetical protein
MTSAGVREHLRSNVVGYVALFLVVAGGAASALPGRNTIDSGDIKRGQVKTSDLATGAVGSAKVADDALTGADVDESSLSLPPIPSTLPPSGAAGGDLDGNYPAPSVREAGLTAGGDLSGSLADAQLGSDSVGAPEIATDSVGAPEIATDSVGDAEIEDGIRDILIPAGVVDDSRLGGAGSPAAGATAVGSYPALLFDPTSAEKTQFVVQLPPDMVPVSVVSVAVLWSAPNTGNVNWSESITSVTPETAETLAEAAFSSASGTDSIANANELKLATIGGAASPVRLVPGDVVKVEITRNAAAASDNLAGDAALLAVRLRLVARR